MLIHRSFKHSSSTVHFGKYYTTIQFVKYLWCRKRIVVVFLDCVRARRKIRTDGNLIGLLSDVFCGCSPFTGDYLGQYASLFQSIQLFVNFFDCREWHISFLFEDGQSISFQFKSLSFSLFFNSCVSVVKFSILWQKLFIVNSVNHSIQSVQNRFSDFLWTKTFTFLVVPFRITSSINSPPNFILSPVTARAVLFVFLIIVFFFLFVFFQFFPCVQISDR